MVDVEASLPGEQPAHILVGTHQSARIVQECGWVFISALLSLVLSLLTAYRSTGYRYCIRTDEVPINDGMPQSSDLTATSTTSSSLIPSPTRPIPPGPTNSGVAPNCNAWHVVQCGLPDDQVSGRILQLADT